jgi:hypothetical protein
VWTSGPCGAKKHHKDVYRNTGSNDIQAYHPLKTEPWKIKFGEKRLGHKN